MKKSLLLTIIFVFIINVDLYSSDLYLSGIVEEIFDDNVYASKDSKNMDFATRGILNLGVESESSRGYFGLIGNLLYKKYYKYTDEDSFSQDLDLKTKYDLTRNSSISINNKFGHYPEAQSQEDSFFRISQSDGYYVNTFEFGFTTKYSNNLEYNAKYYNRVNRSTSGNGLNSDQNKGVIECKYSFNSSNILGLYYGFDYTAYENSSKFYNHEPAIGYSYFFTEKLSLNPLAGLNLYTIDGTTSYSTNKPFYSISLIYELSTRSLFTLSYSKKYTAGIDTPDLYNYQSFSMIFRNQFTQRLGFTFIAFWGHGKYENFDSENKVLSFLTFVSYDFSKRLSGKISISSGYLTVERNIITISVSGKI